jgi:hypothetical protein
VATRINISLDLADLEQLREAAEAAGETLSGYLVRSAIDRATSEGADLGPRARAWLRRELRARLAGLID